jgi:hypothetical protein
MSLCVLIVNPQWGLGQSGSGSRLYQRKLSLNVANNRVSHHLNANYQNYFFPIVKGDIIGNCAAQMTSNDCAHNNLSRKHEAFINMASPQGKRCL